MTAPESMILIEQESRWTKFQRAWQGKFGFLSGPSAQAQLRDEQNRKRKWQFYLALGVSVGLGTYAAHTFYEPIDLEETGSESARENTELSALPPVPALSLEESETLDDETDEDESDEVGATAQDSGLLYEGLEALGGANSQDKVMDALEQIESWGTDEGAYPVKILSQYLFHKKVWVRLTALQFAIDGEVLPQTTLENVAKDISQKNNRGQILRFLERPRHLNYEVYSKMRMILIR